MTRLVYNPLQGLILSPRRTAIGAWAVIGLFVVLTAASLTGGKRIMAPVATVETTANPTVLTAADRGLYLMIRSAQTAGDFARADALMAQLNNRLLVGYVLAERYLSPNYTARSAELSRWLAQYADHPQATRIASLATRQGVVVTLPKQPEPLQGAGYGDHLGRSGMPDSWYTALAFWREKNYASAETLFAKLSEDASLSDWQRSAAYYWTYRAATRSHNAHAAQQALHNAAEYTTTFYGLLAGAQLNKLRVDADAPEVSDSLRYNPRAIRATLLAQLGDNAAAETELRALYGAVSTSQRAGIVTLASELGLSNLQMRLARAPGLSEAEKRFALYPTPHYMIALDSVMDSALVMSVARNESGFREVARNGSSGALGMMQMLPTTAQAVERHVGESLLQTAEAGASSSVAKRLSNPATSARYGAEYLKLLKNLPAIDGNLVHLLVGYNAGPGTVVSWKAAARTIDDPLLYIESIPYAETRNYVMQVSAQYWTYQLMMDETPTSLRVLSKGEWPKLPKAGA